MAVILNELKPLHRSMLSQKLTRQKFEYIVKDVIFDVFFFIDNGYPFQLLFGAKGHNLAFHFDVQEPYVVQDVGIRPESVYFKLREILGIEAGTGPAFSGQSFLKDFRSHIPNTASPQKTPEAHETASVRRDVPEGDKVFFYGWRDNDAYKTEVREVNLKKTLELLGQDTHDFCVEKNMSTKWTDIPGDRKKFYWP